MRRLLAQMLLVLGLPIGLVLTAASPASACTIDTLTPAQQHRLSYIFAGEVTDVAESAQDGARTRIYTIAVQKWWRGDLPARVRVESPVRRADCGLRGVREGSEYLFLADQADGSGRIQALSFQGTKPSTKRVQKQMTNLTGVEPQAPVVETAPTPVPDPTATVLDESDPPDVVEAVTPAAILVLIGAVLFAVGAALGRRER